MFTFNIADDKDKKTKEDKKRSIINREILEISKQLREREELYSFSDLETLNKICERIKILFAKDTGYFQVFAYIF